MLSNWLEALAVELYMRMERLQPTMNLLPSLPQVMLALILIHIFIKGPNRDHTRRMIHLKAVRVSHN